MFQPDRKHQHYQLLNLGYVRRKVVLELYVFTAFFLLLVFTWLLLECLAFPVDFGNQHFGHPHGGYIDTEAEPSNSVLTVSCSIEAIMDVARRGSELSADWCRETSCQML